MLRPLLFLSLVLLPLLPTFAEEPPPPAGPEAAPSDQRLIPVRPEAQVPTTTSDADADRPRRVATFLERYVSYDPDTDTARMGHVQRTISHEELFLTLGRPDLAQEVRARKRLKTGLLMAGGGVVLAEAAAAVWLVKYQVDPVNDPRCQSAGAYNLCTSARDQRSLLAAAVLGSGAAVAMALFGSALFMDLEPLPHEEILGLARKHNQQLLRVSVAPVLAPTLAGLSANLTF